MSERLFNRVTLYHATIGADVSVMELERLETKLLDEARQMCLKHNWEEALEHFTHALAVNEKRRTGPSGDAGGRGTLVHNIAFCLHCIGEFEAAKAKALAM